MRQVIPIAKPWMDEESVAAASRAILSGWVTQGPEVEAFEQEFAVLVGATYACAVSSGTTALHLALLAVGVEPGDEVVTVSHSFIATAHSVRYCGATPVFVDIQPETFNMDPASLARAITPRTRAILCVHQLGMPCDLEAILRIGHAHGLPVVEDAACAVGSEIERAGAWERIGKPHGDIACFSFHPRKLITTGDGGMLTTANPEWDRQFRLRRQHGMDVSARIRHGSQELLDRGVASRRGVMCAPREPAYGERRQTDSLRESEAAQDHCILLSIFYDLTEADQDYVVAVLQQICQVQYHGQAKRAG
jgi:dTDP-4-amino-4,6-dideoxygalactose transaminase